MVYIYLLYTIYKKLIINIYYILGGIKTIKY